MSKGTPPSFAAGRDTADTRATLEAWCRARPLGVLGAMLLGAWYDIHMNGPRVADMFSVDRPNKSTPRN